MVKWAIAKGERYWNGAVFVADPDLALLYDRLQEAQERAGMEQCGLHHAEFREGITCVPFGLKYAPIFGAVAAW